MRISVTLCFLLGMAGGRADAACAAAAFHQFDFWLGEWQVYQRDGSISGENRVSLEVGGCVLHERYRTASGYEGESFNIYDVTRQLWHQTWVDNGGQLLVLEGRWQDGSMVLEGDGFDASGKPARQRIQWTPNADGSVRQLWSSQTESQSWQTVFDGLYRKRVTATP